MWVLSDEVGEVLGPGTAPRECEHDVVGVSTQSLDKSELQKMSDRRWVKMRWKTYTDAPRCACNDV